jgi:hypothetical protein
LLVVLFEVCSLVLPLGELSLDVVDDECSLVVGGGATTIGAGAATTIGAGATTTGAAYATAGAGAEVVVWLVELVVSVLCANPTDTLPNSTAIPNDKAEVLNECFIIVSPLVLL